MLEELLRALDDTLLISVTWTNLCGHEVKGLKIVLDVCNNAWHIEHRGKLEL